MDYVKYNQERTVDTQYHALLDRILTHGKWGYTQMEEDACRIEGAQLVYQITNGIPVIVERDIVTLNKNSRSIFTQSVGEILAFVNGSRTTAEIEEYGCYWWNRWASEEKCKKRGLVIGDLGPGSYGGAWGHFPDGTENGFNQIDALIAQIKEKPHLKTHVLSPWIPQYVFRATGYKQKVVVVPCHGWVHIMTDTTENTFTLVHNQRSGDVPVGIPTNLIGYSVLGLMIAKITGMTFNKLIFNIDDAHIYSRQVEKVKILLERESGIYPLVFIRGEQKTMYEVKPSDIVIDEYVPTGKPMLIPTPT